MFSPSTDVVSQSPQSGQERTTESLSSAAWNRTSFNNMTDNQAIVLDRVNQEPGEMFSPSTDVVSQFPQSGHEPTTESLSSAALNRTSFNNMTDNQAIVLDRVNQEPGEMFSPSTDVVCQSPQSGHEPTTESLSSASLNRTSFSNSTENQAISWHPIAVHEGVHMDEVHRVVSDFLGLSTTGEGMVVKQEVTQDEQLLTEGDISAVRNTSDGYHLRASTSHGIIDSQSCSSSESDDVGFKVIKKQKCREEETLNHSISLSEKFGDNQIIDNSGIDVHWVRSDKIYKCGLCQKVCKDLERVRTHIRCHLGVRPFACPRDGCQKTFTHPCYISKHVKQKHDPPTFQCSLCNEKFISQKLLAYHESNVHKNIKPVKCKLCNMSFVNDPAYWFHLKKKHKDTPRPDCEQQCEICGLLIKAQNLLNHRERVHFKIQDFKCYGCRKRFREKSELERHAIIHKNELFKCDICLKTLISKRRFLIHTKVHKRNASKCHICDKLFKSKHFLQGHLLQHEGIRKHCCNICGKTFFHRHYLQTHLKSHGEKKFTCDLCGGKFNRKDNLKSHIKRHSQNGKRMRTTTKPKSGN